MEAIIPSLLDNQILLIAISSYLSAQFIKILIELLKNKRFDIGLMVSSGGMPSSHSSFVTSMMISIGLKEGFDSSIFAMSAVISSIVMYDAAGVRFAAGRQAAAINMLIEKLNDPNISLDKKLKELLGHTPLQVIMGALLGLIVGIAGANVYGFFPF